MTRTPASTSAGASSAAAASGSARNTTSASRASVSSESGTMAPFQSRASAGSRRDAPPVWPDDIAAVSATRGMARQQAQQLLAGVAGGAGDRDARASRRAARRRAALHQAAQLYASERIVIHSRL